MVVQIARCCTDWTAEVGFVDARGGEYGDVPVVVPGSQRLNGTATHAVPVIEREK